MGEFSFDGLKLIELIKEIWHKKIVLFIIIPLIAYLCFIVLNDYLAIYLRIGLFIFTSILFLIIWFILNDYLKVNKTCEVEIILNIIADDEVSFIQGKKLFNLAIKQLADQISVQKLKVTLLNFSLENNLQIQNYFNANKTRIDGILSLKLSSGNSLNPNSFKLKVNEFNFLGYSGSLREYEDIPKFGKEFGLRLVGTNWEYLEVRSFDDKARIKDNFSDIILFLVGINLVIQNKLEQAIYFLDKLKGKSNNLKGSQLALKSNTKLANEDLKLIKNNRLLTILAEVYLRYILQLDQKGEKVMALKAFNSIDQNFINNNYSFEFNCIIARLYYEIGDLKKSKEYTGKMKAERGPEDLAVILNENFYFMIEKNDKKFASHCKRILKTDTKGEFTNYVEIISFINDNRYKYPGLSLQFDILEEILVIKCNMPRTNLTLKYPDVENLSLKKLIQIIDNKHSTTRQ